MPGVGGEENGWFSTLHQVCRKLYRHV